MNSKKVLLIGPASLEEAPYIKPYINILQNEKIDFDFVFWNRKMDDVTHLPSNFIPYNKFTDNSYSNIKKIIKIFDFYKFTRNLLKHTEYSTIVIFTIQHAVFFENYLINKFTGNFVVDIRDNSPVLRIPFFKKKLKKLIKYSATTVISSEGFIKWLPKIEKGKYTISHNVSLENIKYYLDKNNDFFPNGRKRILTIGAIRDFESNSFVIKQLANNSNFELQFAGSGLAVEKLQAYAKGLNANDVKFTGKYQKKDENNIVDKSDMINIYFNHDINSDSLMSNRFYLSAMLRKPMIVNDGCFQADQVRKYGLGVVIYEGNNMSQEILDYWRTFDSKMYNENCIQFLSNVEEDILVFNKRLLEIVLSSQN